jgi:hypothetical protein
MKKVFSLICILIVIGCDSNEIIESRSFYMGFTVNEKETLTSFLVENSEILHYHFEGVPWTVLQTQNSIPGHLLDVWELQRSSLPPTHKLYISVSPFSEGWNSLANDNSGGPLIEEMTTLSFDDEKVISAYLKYCKSLIDFFSPQYFNMAVEANILFLLHPDRWQSFMKFHWLVYTGLKSAYPELPIFTSVAAEPALQNFVRNCDYLLQRLPILQLVENSDLYSLTIHPKSVSRILSSNDTGEFSALFHISKKDFALSLNGTNQYGFLDDGNNVAFGKLKISAGLNQTLSKCLKRKAVFVVRSLEDIDEKKFQNSVANFQVDNLETTTSLWKKYLNISFN